MKLLIVDDEELTRTGLISSIDWDSLGITEILQADDGVNGLEMAKLYKPEIILCDVRMPRMTGIAMLERLEKFLPDSIPIFMSGYSDKEYLKAAIKLKAINYIEKPLHPEEVQAAVLEAQTLYKQKLRSHRGEAIHSQEIATRLAQQLTLPPSDNNKIADLCLELGQSELLERHEFYLCDREAQWICGGLRHFPGRSPERHFPFSGALPSEMSFCGKKGSVSGSPHIWKKCTFPDYPFRSGKLYFQAI